MNVIFFGLVVILTTTHFCQTVSAARILAVLPIFAGSHQKFFQPLLKALARAGHDVVVYSPFPLATPVANYTDVVLDNSPTESQKITEIFLKITQYPHRKCLDIHYDFQDVLFRPFLDSEKIKTLLESGQKFDLVISEAFTTQEYVLILGHIFNSPVIVLQSMVTNSLVNWYSGNVISVTSNPDLCSPFSDNMTFRERFLNSLYILRNMYYIYYSKYLPEMNNKLMKHFPYAPRLEKMIQNVVLVFVNDHLTADYPQPRTPNIIPVAGIHIEEEQPLPKDIKVFMDEAQDGVIFFSLGTYVPDELKEKEYFDMYIRVFSQLKQRVLWKTRKENIEGLPFNVKTLKWAPQRDILAHPKMVLFITHGGLLSQHETVHCGVPVVVIPQFSDQHRNARFYQEKGVGVSLAIPELSDTSISTAIHTVLYNPKYAGNMRKLSQLFRDRPMTPAETVVYWTEHVLRHGGSHLRPASTQLAWYQLALLDVLAVLLTIILVTSILVFLTARFLMRLCFSQTRAVINKEKFC